MNYYWFNRQEIFQKAKENYSKEKEKAAEYYKYYCKEKSRERYKNLLQEQKDKIKEYQKKKKKKSRIGSVLKRSVEKIIKFLFFP